LSAGSTIFELTPQYSSLTLGADSAISVGAGENRPLMFVIARSCSRRGNLARAQDSLKVIIEPQK